MLGVWVAFDPRLHRADALCRAVAPLAFRGRAVQLDQHGVVNIAAKCALNGF